MLTILFPLYEAFSFLDKTNFDPCQPHFDIKLILVQLIPTTVFITEEFGSSDFPVSDGTFACLNDTSDDDRLKSKGTQLQRMRHQSHQIQMALLEDLICLQGNKHCHYIKILVGFTSSVKIIQKTLIKTENRIYCSSGLFF